MVRNRGETPILERLSGGVREKQIEQFEIERDSLEAHRGEAKRMVCDLLTQDARILVFDLSQGGLKPEVLKDPKFAQELQERQFGGGKITHGEALRTMLGFDPNDPRVTIWDVPTQVERKHLPFPDVWVTTGGPAMPSELNPGQETENTDWLRRTVASMAELSKTKVPGIAVCLGHQLFEYSRGAAVGKRRLQREFGTVQMEATPEGKDLQLLYGFWDDEGKVAISSSHSEGVLTQPSQGDFKVIAFNEYTPYQGAVHALGEQSVEEAAANDEVVLSIQNHPELLAMYLEALRNLRGEAMRKEGLHPEEMIFKNTPNARNIWLRFIELAGRRIEKRKK